MKTVLFTGATGGLGMLCVRALSATGRWKVYASGTNEAALNDLAALPNVTPLHMDITQQASVNAALDTVRSQTDRLDAIAHFAGLSAFTPLVEGDSVEQIERLLSVNVTGAARVNRAFFELIHKAGGRIVHCTSESGWMTPQPFAGPYVLSKYAMEAYNDSLRRELMFLNIPVIKIQPGSYETKLTGQVSAGFDRTLASTRYFHDVLTKMKPMMAMELNQKNDPARLTRKVLRALEAKRPRIRYRVGTGKMLALLEFLPQKAIDRLYKVMLKFF